MDPPWVLHLVSFSKWLHNAVGCVSFSYEAALLIITIIRFLLKFSQNGAHFFLFKFLHETHALHIIHQLSTTVLHPQPRMYFFSMEERWKKSFSWPGTILPSHNKGKARRFSQAMCPPQRLLSIIHSRKGTVSTLNSGYRAWLEARVTFYHHLHIPIFLHFKTNHFRKLYIRTNITCFPQIYVFNIYEERRALHNKTISDVWNSIMSHGSV